MTPHPRIRQAALLLASITGEQVKRARLLADSASVQMTTPQGGVVYLTPDDRLYRSPVSEPDFRP